MSVPLSVATRVVEAAIDRDIDVLWNDYEVDVWGVIHYVGRDLPVNVGRLMADRAWILRPIAYRSKGAPRDN